jgi:hypothetical protein
VIRPTLHVLRHSFARLAGDLGYSEATTATLIGNKGHSITSTDTDVDAFLRVAGSGPEFAALRRLPNRPLDPTTPVIRAPATSRILQSGSVLLDGLPVRQSCSVRLCRRRTRAVVAVSGRVALAARPN